METILKLPRLRFYITLQILAFIRNSVADPGFPVGGADRVGRAADSRCGYVSKILCVDKESGLL